MIPWRVSHLLGSAICQNLCKDLPDPSGACLPSLYTSNEKFSELRHLVISWLPWPMTSLRNSSRRSKRRRKFDAVDPFTISTDLQDVSVIPKLLTTHSPNLLQSQMCLSGQIVRGITQTNRRRWGIGMMEDLEDLVGIHDGEDYQRILMWRGLDRRDQVTRRRAEPIHE